MSNLFVFHEEKYLLLAQKEGVGHALTVLHQDLEHWDQSALAKPQEYDLEQIKFIKKIRDFSQKLWDLRKI